MSQTEEFIINLRQIQMAILDYANKPLQDPALKKQNKTKQKPEGAVPSQINPGDQFLLKTWKEGSPDMDNCQNESII